MTDIEQIVKDVLSSMASGKGLAHSEKLLLTEVVKQHLELLEKQTDVQNAISSLVQKGVIVHDTKMPDWIYLKR